MINTKSHFLLVVLLIFFQVLVNAQCAIHSYTANDNEYSIKNSFSITIEAPYQLDLALENSTDGAYLSLSKVENDYWINLVNQDENESHAINIIGTIKDNKEKVISAYKKKFIVQQKEPEISTSKWMSGEWSVRFPVSGGAELDSLVANGANYEIGVSQIDSLKTIGYVITNFTRNATGCYFTLRDNPYIDIAKEIHPGLVPSKANEQIILDVIAAFKKRGLKVILYLAGDGPATRVLKNRYPEYTAAWTNYYNTKHEGDEGAAWRLLCKGFAERFKGLVDGYWIDHAVKLPGELSSFVKMLKNVDPNLAITVNDGKTYFPNKTVASNGDGPANYKVIKLVSTKTHSDFTTGHPTPLVTGAPPNSWAYEEFTFKEIENQPWSELENKYILRHWWGPMRQKWNGQNDPLLFDAEQAYRFVRTVTDAGGAYSWSNTILNGAIPQDEFKILKTIDQRMQLIPKPEYQPYKRPEGAYLKEEVTMD